MSKNGRFFKTVLAFSEYMNFRKNFWIFASLWCSTFDIVLIFSVHYWILLALDNIGQRKQVEKIAISAKFFRFTVVIRYLRKNQNLRLVCQNLTGITNLPFLLFSINKYHSDYIKCDDPNQEDQGHKWSLSALLRHLKANGIDTVQVKLCKMGWRHFLKEHSYFFKFFL